MGVCPVCMYIHTKNDLSLQCVARTNEILRFQVMWSSGIDEERTPSAQSSKPTKRARGVPCHSTLVKERYEGPREERMNAGKCRRGKGVQQREKEMKKTLKQSGSNDGAGAPIALINSWNHTTIYCQPTTFVHSKSIAGKSHVRRHDDGELAT